MDVVIVNWNSGNSLERCLQSLSTSKNKSVIHSVVVVDNDSKEGSQKCVDKFPISRLLQSAENVGFAKACNWGAIQGKADWILFLNPDTVVPVNTLMDVEDRLVGVSDRIGVIGVKLLSENGVVSRSCARIPTAKSLVLNAIGLDRFFRRYGFPMREWDHLDTRDVDHVMGAFYLIRRNLYSELHGFDERFFLYLEDLDLSKRCLEHGKRIQYWADIAVVHEGGGCSKQIRAKRLFCDLRSRWIFASIHFSRFPRMLYFFVTLFVEPFTRILHSSVASSANSLKETCFAYMMFARWLMVH